ncbi:MAG: formylglycine-generating enzyme family protein [Acidobacteria bacterium]|nr:formylglycine-generating enzyme family protein [Acidobacteriota bacterium]
MNNLRFPLWLPLRFALLVAVTFVVGCEKSLPAESQTHPAGHHVKASSAGASEQAGFSAAGVNKTPAPGAAPAGMIWIPGGTFRMGCDDCNMPDAEPVHLVTVDGYWFDETPVTNKQFAEFVKATGYVTIAEIKPKAEDYPGAKPEMLVAGSVCFAPPDQPVPLDNPYVWWKYQPGANWKHPEGPGSDLKGREDHPVVHIAWDDAVAYAKWAGKRLPTEAEFEFAARGGMDGKMFAWGNELKPGGKWVANIWQGHFPDDNKAEDGYRGSSPVKAFPPNAFGLYDVGGNVWQWCADWYRPDYFEQLAAAGTARNPQGPPDSFDPQEPGIPKRVQKSGSFMCSDQYCARYHVGSRGKGATDSGGSHIGFRCAKS